MRIRARGSKAPARDALDLVLELAERRAPAVLETPSESERLWAEERTQAARVAELAASVARNDGRVAEAETAERDGRREVARRVARGEITEEEQAELVAGLAEAVGLERDAARRSRETLAAAEEARVENALDLERATEREHGAKVAAADAEVARIEAELAAANAAATECRIATEDALEAVREARIAADPAARKAKETLDAQRAEQVKSFAMQPDWRWRQEAPRRLWAAIEAERARRDRTGEEARERDLRLSAESWARAGGHGDPPTMGVG